MSSESSQCNSSFKDYIVLMETNGKECESWYYFIKKTDNEDALSYLKYQLDQIDWYIFEDLSTFDLDLDNTVSATTAKEMTKILVNSYSFHRKFDGKLDMINFGFTKKDNNEKKMCKVFDIIGYGRIEDYIEDEDVDDEEYEEDSDLQEDDSDSESSSEEERHTYTRLPQWIKISQKVRN